MANIKFTEFPSATVVGSMDIIPIVQDGANKKTTAAVFQTYIGSLFVGLAGTQTITGSKTFSSPIISNVAIGTAPFSVVSTTKVTNLNADLLDGLSSAAFQSALTLTTTGTSGAATLVGATLNIPNYGTALANYLPLSGGTLTGVLNGTSAVFSSSVSMVGNGKITSITPFLELRDTNWAASTFVQTGVNVGATASGDYFNIFNPAGKGLSYVRNGVVDFMISSAGNVGIATTTPNDYSIGSTAKVLQVTGSAYGIINANAGSVYAWLIADTIAAAVGTQSNHDFKITTNNVERMRITSAGNVGIGTTSPSAKLEIQSSTDLVLNLTRAGVGTWGANVTSAGNLFLTNRFGTTILTLADLGAATFSSSVTAGGNLTITGSSNLGNEASNVTAGGYTTRISGASLLSGALYYGSYGNLILNANNEYTASSRRFLFTNALDGTKFAIVRSANATTDPSFAADGVLASGTADFVITNTGNVLIGTTTNAGYKLDVNGTARVNGDLSIPYGNTIRAINGTHTKLIETGYNGEDFVSIYTPGNTSGTAKLTLLANNAATFAGSVKIGSYTTTQINALAASAGMVVFNTTLATLCFYDGSGWRKVSHSSM